MTTMIKNRNQDKPEPIKIDDRGRISLPKSIRDKMGVETGDTVFALWRHGDLVLRKAINPFDVLVEDAIREYKSGQTRNIDDLAAEFGVDLDHEE